mmetsp:Transcript_66309/g.154018  ORF Transcript_66309/g.154018 Transcript_66309/m.154018 type:complete len:290 (+) Transcript_66309:96-965(+)|eukprot:CAMPEP_0171060722 /NCGR_PEP_ID=MMETSP0766_2-20121228/4001_1 /TAXON_ID=439317 /ORGANISM="Gambierdiscus australes, Strain CAWD 149" /LENGTH=289 /DNA_ID=CAMNT_0011516325 /DNA_START=94 /DNA_END=963 /DNA_ORIENTATION=+
MMLDTLRGLGFASTIPAMPITYISTEEDLKAKDDNARVRRTIAAAERLLPGAEMSSWLRDWCTRDRVLGYVRECDGNTSEAGVLLAKALEWRQLHADVLKGIRVPNWTSDMRVLTVGSRGHPVIYACMGHVKSSARAGDEIDHLVAVLEAAQRAMPPGVTKLDAVFDAHGCRFANFLDPRPMLAVASALRSAYRGILRIGVVVDAPWALSTFLWNAFYPVVPTATRDKIKFASKEECLEFLVEVVGAGAAEVLDNVMTRNRSEEGPGPPKLPSEVGEWQAQPTEVASAQ